MSSCTEFCDLIGPIYDHPLDADGRWCVSRPVAREVSAHVDGVDVTLTVDLVARASVDGVGDDRGPHDRRVRLVADELPDHGIKLTSSAARSLATALIVGADQCEQLERDVIGRRSTKQSAAEIGYPIV